MLSTIRRRVTYANVAMTLALVFAMSGGAYAASKFLITSTKQIKPSVLSALKGKAGPAGPAGPAGTTGAVGPAGSAGPQGPAGAAGSKGETGAAGAAGAPGKEGKAGKDGSPWTAGGTLPHGSSETGVWGLNPANTAANDRVQIPISFTVPLAASLNPEHVHLILLGAPTPGGCLGSSEKPEAEPGNLCIWGVVPGGEFTSFIPVNVETAESGAGKNGVSLAGEHLLEGAYGRGEWVVSGP